MLPRIGEWCAPLMSLRTVSSREYSRLRPIPTEPRREMGPGLAMRLLFSSACGISSFSLECQPRERSFMAKKKIDPLNRKQYSAITAALTVTDIPAAVSFYQKAFGFAKRGIIKGPDGKPVHAELTLRGTTLMLGPESPAMGRRTAKSVGASPASLYIYVENVDKVVEKATKLGGSPQGPVM